MQGCRQALQVLRANLGSSAVGCVFYWETKFSLESDSDKWQNAKRSLGVEHYLMPFKKVMSCGKNYHKFYYFFQISSQHLSYLACHSCLFLSCKTYFPLPQFYYLFFSSVLPFHVLFFNKDVQN